MFSLHHEIKFDTIGERRPSISIYSLYGLVANRIPPTTIGVLRNN